MFMNEDLRYLHVLLPSTKETKYRIIISPIGKRFATEGEVTKNAERDQAT
jgi:hypothetical protein